MTGESFRMAPWDLVRQLDTFNFILLFESSSVDHLGHFLVLFPWILGGYIYIYIYIYIFENELCKIYITKNLLN